MGNGLSVLRVDWTLGMTADRKILGIGSALGDDCAGWLVVRALREDPVLAQIPWQICELDRPGLGLLGYFEGSAEVVIVDAMASGAPIGTLRELQLDELAPLPRPDSTHGFGVAEAVELAKVLVALPPKLRLFGLEIDHDRWDLGPSATLLSAVPGAARRLVQCLLGNAP